MDDENVAQRDEAAEPEEEREYDLAEIDTENLDDAMRDALEAVERGEDHLAEAAAGKDSGGSGAGDQGGELATLQAELAELRDRSVRTLADFDNYRKRVARERSEEQRYAAADLAQEILPVVDNLERALDSEGSAEDLKKGVGMVYQQLQSALARHGIERVAALGEPFDPTRHEAVMRIEDGEVAEPTVREEMQSGYMLHERLLRPSMVKVAVPAADPEALETD